MDNKCLFEIKTKRRKYMIRASNLMSAIDLLEKKLRRNIIDSDTSTAYINHRYFEAQ